MEGYISGNGKLKLQERKIFKCRNGNLHLQEWNVTSVGMESYISQNGKENLQLWKWKVTTVGMKSYIAQKGKENLQLLKWKVTSVGMEIDSLRNGKLYSLQ